MRNTIRLMQEAAGDNERAFGELRSLLAKPSPESFLKLAPLISAEYKRDYDRFEAEIEPYLEAQLARWPDKAKQVPQDFLLASAVQVSRPISAGVLWLTERAHQLNAPRLSLVAGADGEARVITSKVYFDKPRDFEVTLDEYHLGEVFKSDIFKNTDMVEITVFGALFGLARGMDVWRAIDANSRFLSKFVWVEYFESVEEDEDGMLADMAAARGWNNLAKVREINIAASYTDPDLFEQHIRAVYGIGYGFEVLQLDMRDTSGMTLQDAQRIIARVNEDTRRGNQRIIARR